MRASAVAEDLLTGPRIGFVAVAVEYITLKKLR
jgi:hypothetical protein